MNGYSCSQHTTTSPPPPPLLLQGKVVSTGKSVQNLPMAWQVYFSFFVRFEEMVTVAYNPFSFSFFFFFVFFGGLPNLHETRYDGQVQFTGLALSIFTPLSRYV